MSRSPLTWMYENLEVGKDLVIVIDRARPPSKALLRRMSDNKTSTSPSDHRDQDVVVSRGNNHYPCHQEGSEEISPISSPLPTKEMSRIEHHDSPNSVVLTNVIGRLGE